MAVTKAEKVAFNKAVKDVKDGIESLSKDIKEIQLKKRKNPALKYYLSLEESMKNLKSVVLYISMSDASFEIMNVKNVSYLDNARKAYYKVVQLLEDIVGTDIDRPLSENKDFIVRIERVNIHQIFKMSNQISTVFNTLRDKYGDGSKWKWSLVDLFIRVAALVKNLTNFSILEQFRDPRNEFFRDREDLISLNKKLLEDAAREARTKYDLSSSAPEDIQKAIRLLTVLRHINILMGEPEEAQKLKNLIDASRERLEADEKKKNKKGKSKK